MRFKLIFIVVIPVLVLSCFRGQKERMSDATTLLALQEELTSTGEAVVWLRGPDGDISSHWIKNDVSGVILVASRADAVAPINGALWRFPVEDRYADYNEIVLDDLVQGEGVTIVLDDEAYSEADMEGDAGDDAGVGSDDESDERAGREEKTCEQRTIQSLPVLLGGIGPHLFMKYEEKQYDCQDTLMRAEDIYMTYNLVDLDEELIVSDAELRDFRSIPSVRALGRDAEYIGSAPVYDGLSFVRLSHVFAYRNAIIQENGDRHWVTDSVEVLGEKLPDALTPYEVAPDLISSFTIMYPRSVPAGWFPVRYDSDEAARLMDAFLKP